MKLSTNKKAIIILVAIMAVSILALAAAVSYVFPASNTVTGTGTPKPVTVTTALVLAPTAWTEGDSITLTATLSQSITGTTVFFYEGTSPTTGVQIGQATTVNGVASISFAGPVGSKTYVAQPQ